MAVVSSQPSAIGLTIRGHPCRPKKGFAEANRARLGRKFGKSLTAHVVKPPVAMRVRHARPTRPLVKKVRTAMVYAPLISQGKVAGRARFVVCAAA